MPPIISIRTDTARHKLPIWIVVILLVVSLSACTSLKRFAYKGYKRDEWQQPDKVVDSLQINPGDQVADLGSGGGYFTFRLADAVGEAGIVYAVDVDQGLLDYVKETAGEKGYANIQTVLAVKDNTGLAADSVDLVFLCNTYHHLEDRAQYFSRLKPALKAGGRVAIIEFTSGWLKSIGHGTPTDEIVGEMQQAGYQLQTRFDFLEKQNFLVFSVADNAAD
ncbi:MAG: methyltransferase domain-containing protein [Gammaproteobacteria bacterium]|nr:methyltransferase domain-containing protein [Gammaproteobacteria bacterium]